MDGRDVLGSSFKKGVGTGDELVTSAVARSTLRNAMMVAEIGEQGLGTP